MGGVSSMLSKLWAYRLLIALFVLILGAVVLLDLFEGDPPSRDDRFLALFAEEVGPKLSGCSDLPEHTNESFSPDVAIFEVAGFDEWDMESVEFEGFQPFGISLLEDRELQIRVGDFLAEEPDDARTMVFYSVEKKEVGSYVFADSGKPSGAKAMRVSIEICVVDRSSWRGVRHRIVLEPDKVVMTMLQHADADKTGGHPEASMLTWVDSVIESPRNRPSAVR